MIRLPSFWHDISSDFPSNTSQSQELVCTPVKGQHSSVHDVSGFPTVVRPNAPCIAGAIACLETGEADSRCTPFVEPASFPCISPTFEPMYVQALVPKAASVAVDPRGCTAFRCNRSQGANDIVSTNTVDHSSLDHEHVVQRRIAVLRVLLRQGFESCP